MRDGGIRGVAISLEKLRRACSIERATPTSAPTLWLDAGAVDGQGAVVRARATNLGGVEFLGGVPGTVGGGMIMNAGTYLGEFKDVTTRGRTPSTSAATLVERDNAACGFRYRHSAIPAPTTWSTGARLRLRPRPRAEIEADGARAARSRARRASRTACPTRDRSSRTRPTTYAGRLIEACGLKGRRVGGARGLAGARQLAGQRRRRARPKICSRWWRSCAPPS